MNSVAISMVIVPAWLPCCFSSSSPTFTSKAARSTSAPGSGLGRLHCVRIGCLGGLRGDPPFPPFFASLLMVALRGDHRTVYSRPPAAGRPGCAGTTLPWVLAGRDLPSPAPPRGFFIAFPVPPVSSVTFSWKPAWRSCSLYCAFSFYREAHHRASVGLGFLRTIPFVPWASVLIAGQFHVLSDTFSTTGAILGPVPQLLLGIAMLMVLFENERNAVQENALAFSPWALTRDGCSRLKTLSPTCRMCWSG